MRCESARRSPGPKNVKPLRSDSFSPIASAAEKRDAREAALLPGGEAGVRGASLGGWGVHPRVW